MASPPSAPCQAPRRPRKRTLPPPTCGDFGHQGEVLELLKLIHGCKLPGPAARPAFTAAAPESHLRSEGVRLLQQALTLRHAGTGVIGDDCLECALLAEGVTLGTQIALQQPDRSEGRSEGPLLRSQQARLCAGLPALPSPLLRRKLPSC